MISDILCIHLQEEAAASFSMAMPDTIVEQTLEKTIFNHSIMAYNYREIDTRSKLPQFSLQLMGKKHKVAKDTDYIQVDQSQQQTTGYALAKSTQKCSRHAVPPDEPVNKMVPLKAKDSSKKHQAEQPVELPVAEISFFHLGDGSSQFRFKHVETPKALNDPQSHWPLKCMSFSQMVMIPILYFGTRMTCLNLKWDQYNFMMTTPTSTTSSLKTSLKNKAMINALVQKAQIILNMDIKANPMKTNVLKNLVMNLGSNNSLMSHHLKQHSSGSKESHMATCLIGLMVHHAIYGLA
ncbi:hypothetical protein L210DRAFT_931437 [Boletus edulis BED1]|uniref:Uncharacterized protein n=1 Tax=Boletus edulis BED1 TaxID=1328754 RepID=A0AAD4BT90_BOLED|nr:hypothetical protein L210DRAFT_931437 [Boletus edulis BED1]